jgi:hypothetical protein
LSGEFRINLKRRNPHGRELTLITDEGIMEIDLFSVALLRFIVFLDLIAFPMILAGLFLNPLVLVGGLVIIAVGGVSNYLVAKSSRRRCLSMSNEQLAKSASRILRWSDIRKFRSFGPRVKIEAVRRIIRGKIDTSDEVGIASLKKYLDGKLEIH